MAVQRYSVTTEGRCDYDAYGEMEEDPKGEYVKFTDFENACAVLWSIVACSDLEMRDGYFAREIARDFLKKAESETHSPPRT